MTIIKQLFEILIRQRQPQDIDYDINAAVLSFFAVLALGYFLTSMQPVYSQPLLYSAAQTIIQTALVFLLLKIAGNDNRFVQTLTALFGVSAMLLMLILILVQVPALVAMPFFINLWSLYISILIFKAALDCRTGLAILVAIAYQIITSLLVLLLFPELLQELLSIFEQA